MSNTQQQSSKLNAAKQVQSKPEEIAPTAKLNFLVKLINQNPWLALVGIWLLLIVLAAAAGSSIIAPSPIADNQAKIALPVTSKPAKTNTQHDRATPLLLLGVALVAGVGSLGLAQRWYSSSNPRQRRRQHLSTPEVKPQENKFSQLDTKLSPVEQVISAEMPISSDACSAQPQVTKNELNEPMVKTLPEAESSTVPNPESLAELLDIRKERSLASFLEEAQKNT